MLGFRLLWARAGKAEAELLRTAQGNDDDGGGGGGGGGYHCHGLRLVNGCGWCVLLAVEQWRQ